MNQQRISIAALTRSLDCHFQTLRNALAREQIPLYITDTQGLTISEDDLDAVRATVEYGRAA